MVPSLPAGRQGLRSGTEKRSLSGVETSDYRAVNKDCITNIIVDCNIINYFENEKWFRTEARRARRGSFKKNDFRTILDPHGLRNPSSFFFEELFSPFLGRKVLRGLYSVPP